MVEMLKKIKQEDEEFDIASLSLGSGNVTGQDENFVGIDPNKNKEQFDKLVDTGQFGILIDLWVPWWSLSSSNCIPPLAPVPKVSISPHPDLYYILIDFIFAYVVAIRTMNGDTDDTHELVKIILSLSQILSQTPTSFTYTSVQEVIQVIRYRFLSSEMKFNPESLAVFLGDVVEILSCKNWVMISISEMMGFMKRKRLLFRKLEYFLGIVESMEEKILEMLVLGIRQQALNLSHDEKEIAGVNIPRKALIEEI
jgi:hypothetical protein